MKTSFKKIKKQKYFFYIPGDYMVFLQKRNPIFPQSQLNSWSELKNPEIFIPGFLIFIIRQLSLFDQ